MPRYEADDKGRRRKSSPSLSADDSSARRAYRERDSDRSHKRHKDEGSYEKRHSRSPERSSRRERRHRSYSRDSYEEPRSRRDRSGDRSPRKHPRDHEDRDRERRRRHRRGRDSPSRSISPQFSKRSKKPLPSQQDAFKKGPGETSETSTPTVEKEKPNFTNTGRLAAESKTVTMGDGSSVVLKYHEPPEARKPPPKDPWRLYVFKGQDLLETIELGGRSCWLIGREKLVADLPIEHPSCSKQHAALQFRYVEKRNEYGDRDGRVRPYLIDLESANGSTINDEPAPKGRYYELMDKDVLKFGLSTREYVLMLPPG